MIENLTDLTEEVLKGRQITREEALALYLHPLDELCQCADRIRRHFCSNQFDICTIINGKSGRCSENCRFCAQSIHNHTGASEYPLLPDEEILEQAKINHEQGVLRYSIVTSGRRLSDREVDEMCRIIRKIREEVGISVCVSFGLLTEQQFRKLKEAGVSRVHNNLETPTSAPPIPLRTSLPLSGPLRRRDFPCAAAVLWGWERRRRTGLIWP